MKTTGSTICICLCGFEREGRVRNACRLTGNITITVMMGMDVVPDVVACSVETFNGNVRVGDSLKEDSVRDLNFFQSLPNILSSIVTVSFHHFAHLPYF